MTQTDGHQQTDADRLTNRKKNNRQTVPEINQQTDREKHTERQSDRQKETNIQKVTETDRQTDR